VGKKRWQFSQGTRQVAAGVALSGKPQLAVLVFRLYGNKWKNIPPICVDIIETFHLSTLLASIHANQYSRYDM
jgi:hypothetical protein